jgi:di/tricarboxylate transporter
MSNAAAALVVIPIAIKAAEQIGAEPRTFAIGVMLAASLSFITPFEPASLLVYKAGNYRFMDFLKIGSLLTLLLLAILLWLLPHFFPLMEA